MKEQIELYKNGKLYDDFSELVDFVENIKNFSAFTVTENDLNSARERIQKEDILHISNFEKSLFD